MTAGEVAPRKLDLSPFYTSAAKIGLIPFFIYDAGMLVRARRLVSWLATLAVAIVIALGIGHLPGAGGVIDELRWLLRQETHRSRYLSRASTLIRMANEEKPGIRVQLFRTLLSDEDPRVVHAGLRLLADRFTTEGDEPGSPLQKGTGTSRSAAFEAGSGDRLGASPLLQRTAEPQSDLQAVFANWFDNASIEDKVAHLPLTLTCALPDARRRPGPTTRARTGAHGDSVPAARETHFPEPSEAIGSEPVPFRSGITGPVREHEWIVELTEDDVRWVIAASLQRAPHARLIAEHVLFGDSAQTSVVAARLRSLDGLCKGPPETPSRSGPQIDSTELRHFVALSSNELPALLADPIPQVRWGAGRILAVAGDRRGVPALCEWLEHEPRFTPLANDLMTDLFGPDWRALCESSGATRAARESDG